MTFAAYLLALKAFLSYREQVSQLLLVSSIQQVCQSVNIAIVCVLGIATFRGNGGMWRKYDSASVATLTAWGESQSRVWQFFHYRREE